MTAVVGAVVLLVDDHRVFAETLGNVLAAVPGIDRVRVAVSLATARAMLDTDWPDLVLLDLALADESGFELLGDLADRGNPPPTIVLSGATDPRLVVRALDAGASGWLSKTTQVNALVAAVWQVLDGNMYLAPAMLRPVLGHLLADIRRQRAAVAFVDDLTARELEVLRCLVSGMTRFEVARQLYVSTNTVRTHVQNLLRRSEQHSTLALVAFARSHGVRGIDEDDDPRSAVAGESSH
jgi:DNA-binding NarL/FixJ family response regulator